MLRDPESHVCRDGALAVAEDNNPFVGLFTVKQLAASVAADLNLPVEKVMGRGRKREYVVARSIVSHFARKRGLSYPAIAKAMGRDHSTIIHQIRSLPGWLGFYSNAREAFDRHALMFERAGKGHNAHVIAWRAHQLPVTIKALPPPPIRRVVHTPCFASSAELARFSRARAESDKDAIARRAGSAALSKAISSEGGWR